LGPVSPSPTLLWSWAEPNGTIVSPSVRTKKLTSSPSRNSSTTIDEPAAQDEFDYRVVNDDLERAAGELERIVRGELGQ
jgi:hypothetical protein